jgi:hypothetical protein
MRIRIDPGKLGQAGFDVVNPSFDKISGEYRAEIVPNGPPLPELDAEKIADQTGLKVDEVNLAIHQFYCTINALRLMGLIAN